MKLPPRHGARVREQRVSCRGVEGIPLIRLMDRKGANDIRSARADQAFSRVKFACVAREQRTYARCCRLSVLPLMHVHR
jgi:hypothetical protein